MNGMNSRRGTAAPAPARERKSAYEIEKGLRQSLESVDTGLKKFLLSLKESRMVEALQGYRALQLTLVQQRLWAHQHSRTQLLPLFRSIARTSGELHRVFSSYAETLNPLKEIDRLGPVAAGLANTVVSPAESQGGSLSRPPAEVDEPAAAEKSP